MNLFLIKFVFFQGKNYFARPNGLVPQSVRYFIVCNELIKVLHKKSEIKNSQGKNCEFFGIIFAFFQKKIILQGPMI